MTSNTPNLKDRLRATCAFARTLLFIMSTLIASTESISAWSNPGHMAVALIAYRQLDDDTRDRVDTLVAMNPKIAIWRSQLPSGATAKQKKEMLFMIAATWADQIKSDRRYELDGEHNGNAPPADGSGAENLGYSDLKKRKYWHYIDMPFSRDGTELIDPPTPNAETQIDAFRAVLNSEDAEDELKSFDLVWLLHLVGDVHQPLHCAARFTASDSDGDDGGNGVTVLEYGQTRTLHSFWDGLFGSTNKLRDGISIAKSFVATLPAAETPAADDLDTGNWIQEGFDLAKLVVYKNPPIKNGTGNYNVDWYYPPQSNNDTYRSRAVTAGRKQIALGGARLGKILNTELR